MVRGLFPTKFLDSVDDIGWRVPASSRINILIQEFGRIEEDACNEFTSVASGIEQRDLGVWMQVQG